MMQWSKIFLPEMKSAGGIDAKSSQILTSQSVFCFPMGMVKDKLDMKSVEGTENETTKTPQKAISKVVPKLLNVQNSASTSNKQNTFRYSNPFMNSNTTADGFQNDEFDRRSAGNRFGASAYHEFIKVNNLFSGVAFKRRQSCSKS